MTAGLMSQAIGTLPGVPCGDPAGGLIIQQYTLNGGTGQQRDAAPGDGPFRIPWLAAGKLLTVHEGVACTSYAMTSAAATCPPARPSRIRSWPTRCGAVTRNGRSPA
jgi:hypothetical protein